MMRTIMKCTVVLVMAGMLLLPGIGLAIAAAADGQAGDKVLDQLFADVTGDGSVDTVSLLGKSNPQGGRFVSDLYLVVIDGGSQTEHRIDLLKFGGYDAKLFAGDFDGDKVADILISAPTGGSGGAVGNRIVVFANDAPRIIFGDTDNRGVRFTGEYLDGYQVRLTNTETERSLLLDESARQTNYQQIRLYDEEGKLLQPREPFIDPFGRLDPVDVDGDGIYELRGIQRISGAYHADSLAEVQSLWKYASDGWLLKKLEVTPLPRDGSDPVVLYNPEDLGRNCIILPGNATI